MEGWYCACIKPIIIVSICLGHFIEEPVNSIYVFVGRFGEMDALEVKSSEVIWWIAEH